MGIHLTLCGKRRDNFWMKKLLLFFILFSSLSRAADQVLIYDQSNLSITGVTNTSFTLFSSAASGDATSESAPAKIYVPLETTTSNTNRDYYYQNTSGSTVKNLFGYASSTNASTYSGYTITYPLEVTVGSTAKYIYAAVKTASGYTAIAKSSSTYSGITSNHIDFSLSPQTICAAMTSETTNCTSFDIDGTPVETTKTFTIFYFLDSNSTLVNSAITASSYSGVYFQVNMSNRIYTATELYITLNSLSKGDKRLIANYTNSATMSDLKYAIPFIHSGAACSTDSTVSACTGSFNTSYTSSTQNGDLTIGGLTNDSPYTISMALIDIYGFSTLLSNSKTGTPIQIEELLKKQSCFLLTAGFGEEHFVIDYFRNFRDHILLASAPGKLFVHFYYKYAPSFALSIYNNEPVRWGIRTFAYTLYFVFNYFWIITSILSLILIIMIKKRDKLLKF